MPKRNQLSQKRRRQKADHGRTLDRNLLQRDADKCVAQVECDERRRLEAAGHSGEDLERLIEQWGTAQFIRSYRALQVEQQGEQESRGRRSAKKLLLARQGDPKGAFSSGGKRELAIPRRVLPREVLRELNGLLSVH